MVPISKLAQSSRLMSISRVPRVSLKFNPFFEPYRSTCRIWRSAVTELLNHRRCLKVMPNFSVHMRGYNSGAYNDWKDHLGHEKVELLTTANFDAFLRRHDATLVMFYAPWCYHCRVLKPEYAKAALALSKITSNVKLAAVDCTAHPEVQMRYKITGFPTLILFRGNTVVGEYQQRRRAVDIVDYMLTEADY